MKEKKRKEKKRIIKVEGKEYNIYESETIFRFTSALGLIMAEGIIFKKEIPYLKEFREKTIHTEVFIYDDKKEYFIRADSYGVN